jgi:hypothetical protein
MPSPLGESVQDDQLAVGRAGFDIPDVEQIGVDLPHRDQTA